MSKATIVLVFAITISVTFSCAPKEQLIDLRAKSSSVAQIDDLEKSRGIGIDNPSGSTNE